MLLKTLGQLTNRVPLCHCEKDAPCRGDVRIREGEEVLEHTRPGRSRKISRIAEELFRTPAGMSRSEERLSVSVHLVGGPQNAGGCPTTASCRNSDKSFASTSPRCSAPHCSPDSRAEKSTSAPSEVWKSSGKKCTGNSRGRENDHAESRKKTRSLSSDKRGSGARAVELHSRVRATCRVVGNAPY